MPVRRASLFLAATPSGRWLALVLVVVLTFLAALNAAAQTYPALTGRIVDNAKLLDANAEQRLTALLQGHEDKTTDQVVVATIPALNGENLEDYANRLFRHWKLGQADKNNGVLFLVARDDRKLRIEVGYGLEGTLTDALASRIINETVVPAFRQGDFSGGIERGAGQILRVLNEGELPAPAWRDNGGSDPGETIVMSLFITVWLVIFLLPLMLSVLPRIYGKKIGKNKYVWLGMTFDTARRSSSSGGFGGGFGGGSGGFGGGGGSSGGGGASGGW